MEQETQVQEEPQAQSEKVTDNLPDFNTLGEEFNSKIVEHIREYANQLPLGIMVKALQNLATDLIFNHTAVQIKYNLQELEQKFATPKSKIIL